jgi:hypothetical protein
MIDRLALGHRPIVIGHRLRVNVAYRGMTRPQPRDDAICI